VFMFFSLNYNDHPVDSMPVEKYVSETKLVAAPIQQKENRGINSLQKEHRSPQKTNQISTLKSEKATSPPIEVKEEKGIPLLAGEVKIYDFMGNEIASIISGVLSGGIIALPRRACLGGVTWKFYAYDSKEERAIIAGLWRESDETIRFSMGVPRHWYGSGVSYRYIGRGKFWLRTGYG